MPNLCVISLSSRLAYWMFAGSLPNSVEYYILMFLQTSLSSHMTVGGMCFFNNDQAASIGSVFR